LWVTVIWKSTRQTRATVIVACCLAGLMNAQYVAAASGLLREWERRPPPFVVMFGGTLALTLWLAFSKLGARVARGASAAVLIGMQIFRLPLELTMHRAAGEGVMPVQMSYSGYNFDIISGATALVLVFVAGKASWTLLRIWNVLGFCLLVNIVIIAVVSTPQFALFGPDRLNIWVAEAPFVWLPGVLVPAALLGHVLLWRKLKNGGSLR